MLPNFVIGGAQKSGTTFLHHLLASHPDVFLPARPQELHYFDLDENFERGAAWYEAHFEAWAGEACVGQTSPLYLYDPRVPERLRALLPEARLVFVLRRPPERAWAHYWHEVKKGWEDLDFEAALNAEPERLARGGEFRRHFSYLDRGRYAEQLERFLALMPRERILVLRYEELRDPKGVAARCAGFLGVDAADFPDLEPGRRRNAARLPRSRRLQGVARRLRGPAPWLAAGIDHLNLVERRYPALDPRLRARMNRELLPDLERLERLLGIELPGWREEEAHGRSAAPH